MKAVVETKEFSKALNLAIKASDGRNALFDKVLLYFGTKASGGSYAIGNRGYIAIKSPFHHEGACKKNDRREGCVKAKEFSALIGQIEDDSISLETTDATMSIITGSGKYRFKWYDPKDVGSYPDFDDPESWNDVPTAEFKNALVRCIPMINASELFSSLAGLHIQSDNGDLAIVGGSRSRMCVYRIPECAVEVNSTMSYDSIKVINSLMAGCSEANIKIGLFGDKVHFKIGDLHVISNTLEAAYPDYNGIMDPAGRADIEVTIDAKKLETAIKRARLTGAAKKQILDIKVSGDDIMMGCSDPTNGESEIGLMGSGKDVDMRLYVDQALLYDASRLFGDDGNVHLRFENFSAGETYKRCIYAIESGRAICAMMPINK